MNNLNKHNKFKKLDQIMSFVFYGLLMSTFIVSDASGSGGGNPLLWPTGYKAAGQCSKKLKVKNLDKGMNGYVQFEDGLKAVTGGTGTVYLYDVYVNFNTKPEDWNLGDVEEAIHTTADVRFLIISNDGLPGYSYAEIVTNPEPVKVKVKFYSHPVPNKPKKPRDCHISFEGTTPWAVNPKVKYIERSALNADKEKVAHEFEKPPNSLVF